LIVRFV